MQVGLYALTMELDKNAAAVAIFVKKPEETILWKLSIQNPDYQIFAQFIGDRVDDVVHKKKLWFN